MAMASSSSRKQSKKLPSADLPPGAVRSVDLNGLRAMIREHEIALGSTTESLTKQEEYQVEYNALLNTLKNLPDKLSHDALVPLGPLVMGHGKLIHTNEITCHIGDNWFVQCTAKTAEKIATHRIQKSNEMLSKFQREKELISAWIEEGKRQLNEGEDEGTVEITEVYNEQQEQEWRQKHRENVRRHHQQAAKTRQKESASPATDQEAQEILDRLELLELEEELNEYQSKQAKQFSSVQSKVPASNPVPAEKSILKTFVTGPDTIVIPTTDIPSGAEAISDDSATLSPRPESIQKRRVSFDSSKDTIHSYPAEPRTTAITSPVEEIFEHKDEIIVDAFKHVVIEKKLSPSSCAKKVEIVSEPDSGDPEDDPPERMSLFKQRKLMREGKL